MIKREVFRYVDLRHKTGVTPGCWMLLIVLACLSCCYIWYSVILNTPTMIPTAASTRTLTNTPTPTDTLMPSLTPTHAFQFNCKVDVYNCDNFPGNFHEYLKQCGSDVSKLDGDGDGAACEN